MGEIARMLKRYIAQRSPPRLRSGHARNPLRPRKQLCSTLGCPEGTGGVGGGLQPLTHSAPDPVGWSSQQPDLTRFTCSASHDRSFRHPPVREHVAELKGHEADGPRDERPSLCRHRIRGFPHCHRRSSDRSTSPDTTRQQASRNRAESSPARRENRVPLPLDLAALVFVAGIARGDGLPVVCRVLDY